MRIIDITRPLTEATPVYPGDVPFTRIITMAVARGEIANVSVFTSSAHVGTHIDTPAHLTDGTAELPLEAYVGPAVVIAVSDWPELDRRAIAPHMRVLFRTANSLSAFTEYDPGYVYPPAPVVDWLLRMGAVLVGVDGPSVDGPDDPALPNHHRLLDAGVAILENVDLSNVDDGEYELIALPMRIPGADGSWVRAVLRGR